MISGVGGTTSSGVGGAGSTGVGGAGSTGVGGAGSTGVAGSYSSGVAGSASSGAAGSSNSGVAGAASTGVGGSGSTGVGGAARGGTSGGGAGGAARGGTSGGGAGGAARGGTSGGVGSAGTTGIGGSGNSTGVGGSGNSGPPPVDVLVPPQALNLTGIPSAHPRLFWNAARLQRARQWFQTHNFTPDTDEPIESALHYVLSGNTQSARRAIDFAMGVTLTTTQVSSDIARWEGERVILAYDWCYDQMTASERSTLITRWNGYIEALNAKPWGAVGMEGNNYYTGYMRNSMEWGIATYGENPRAEAILTDGMTTRWTNSFLPYAAGVGLGGVPHEGTQYGRNSFLYYTVPLVSAGLLGRNMWNETDFFRHSVYYLIYSMPAARMALNGNSSTSYYETFPFTDDEDWRNGNSAGTEEIGTFLSPLLEQWQGTKLAGYIQQYLTTTGAPIARHAQAVQVAAPAPLPFSNLPLDYYAPGIQYFYTRSSWGADGMAVNLQLGVPVGIGHEHMDTGSFQIARKGRWLSRETTSYTEQIVSWNNGPAEDAREGFGHNSVLFQGIGEVDWGDGGRVGPPKVLRLESRNAYSYAAADLTDAYRATEARYDNPNAEKVIREYLFVRPLDALVVLDRMQSSARQMAAANVVKTFIVHSETSAPTLSGNSALITNGDQALQVITLVPSSPVRRVVTEGTSVGQFRLEEDTSGSAEATFLHVLHGRDASAAAIAATVADLGTSWEVTITHPTRGSAKVVFQKGMVSTGGSFGYAASGTPTTSPLIQGVQRQQLTSEGPFWE